MDAGAIKRSPSCASQPVKQTPRWARALNAQLGPGMGLQARRSQASKGQGCTNQVDDHTLPSAVRLMQRTAARASYW